MSDPIYGGEMRREVERLTRELDEARAELQAITAKHEATRDDLADAFDALVARIWRAMHPDAHEGPASVEALVAEVEATRAERDTYRRAIGHALSRLGAEDYDDPCAALAECLDYAETLDREATEEANALRRQRDEARADIARLTKRYDELAEGAQAFAARIWRALHPDTKTPPSPDELVAEVELVRGERATQGTAYTRDRLIEALGAERVTDLMCPREYGPKETR